MLDNLLGRRFGRLIVKDRAEDTVSKSGRHRVMWVCSCDCGNEVVVLSDNLKRGKTQSCGCLRNDKNKERFSTHRATDTRLYGIWSAMKTRCLNKNSHAYKDYGERGIHVCDKWINDFSEFAAWAYSNGYNDNLSIDRIDNNKGYYPDNCRWVISDVQANNRRSNIRIAYNGEPHTVTEWARLLNKNPKTIFSRIYSGWDYIDAITK